MGMWGVGAGDMEGKQSIRKACEEHPGRFERWGQGPMGDWRPKAEQKHRQMISRLGQHTADATGELSFSLHPASLPAASSTACRQLVI